MKKILLTTIYFPPQRGGISNSLWNICIHLPADRVVVLTEPSDINPRSSFPIYQKPITNTARFIWPRWLFLIRDMKRIVEEESIDIIHAGQILPIGTAALILKKLYRIPYHVYVYGQDLMIMRSSKRKMSLIKHILKNADGIIANSNSTKDKAVTLGAAPDKTIVVYPSPISLIDTTIDQQFYDYFIKRYRLRGKQIILTVGNLVPRKGQDKVIQAMPEILRYHPQAHYVVVGNGEYIAHLRSMTDSLSIEEHVQFFTNVTDQELPYFYHACDVFIMPSREIKDSHNKSTDMEGFGIVYLEANLFGKPVIGGNSGGVPEAVAHGVTGLLVDPNNVHDIARAVSKLLSDKQLSEKLGSQGRERALKHFQWEDEMEKIKKLLD